MELDFFWDKAKIKTAIFQHLEEFPFRRIEGEIRQIRYPVDKVIPWTGEGVAKIRGV